MNLKEKILDEHSKKQTSQIVNYVGNNNVRFARLVNLFLGKEPLIAQRAAWAVSYCVESNPSLAKPHLNKFVKNLKQTGLHNSIKRNTMRLLQYIDIPKHLLGLLTNICFGYLSDVKEAIAVRVFSMTVLLNIAKKEPGLKNEIKLIIENMMPNGSAGIRARGKMILKALEKL
ncbi:MAG: hypothetical protein HYU69_01325 [Bacteroidetes bacterium]|nr:hypothetical protein [Bacteroidota bacterium]